MSRRKRGVKEVESIKREAVEKFCPVASNGKRGSTESKRVSGWVDAFAKEMNGDAPYQNVDEAVNAIAPIAITFLGFVFRYAIRKLAIAVIKFCWEKWSEPVVVTTSAGYT